MPPKPKTPWLQVDILDLVVHADDEQLPEVLAMRKYAEETGWTIESWPGGISNSRPRDPDIINIRCAARRLEVSSLPAFMRLVTLCPITQIHVGIHKFHRITPEEAHALFFDNLNLPKLQHITLVSCISTLPVIGRFLARTPIDDFFMECNDIAAENYHHKEPNVGRLVEPHDVQELWDGLVAGSSTTLTKALISFSQPLSKKTVRSMAGFLPKMTALRNLDINVFAAGVGSEDCTESGIIDVLASMALKELCVMLPMDVGLLGTALSRSRTITSLEVGSVQADDYSEWDPQEHGYAVPSLYTNSDTEGSDDDDGQSDNDKIVDDAEQGDGELVDLASGIETSEPNDDAGDDGDDEDETDGDNDAGSEDDEDSTANADESDGSDGTGGSDGLNESNWDDDSADESEDDVDIKRGHQLSAFLNNLRLPHLREFQMRGDHDCAPLVWAALEDFLARFNKLENFDCDGDLNRETMTQVWRMTTMMVHGQTDDRCPLLSRNKLLQARMHSAALRACAVGRLLLHSRALPLPVELRLKIVREASGDAAAFSEAQWRRLEEHLGDEMSGAMESKEAWLRSLGLMFWETNPDENIPDVDITEWPWASSEWDEEHGSDCHEHIASYL